MGTIADSASRVSRHDRPAIDPESSIKKTVSNCDRNAYLSSAGTGAVLLPPRVVASVVLACCCWLPLPS